MFERVREVGTPHGLRLASGRDLETLQIEMGFRAFGPDIGSHDTPIEAGLLFVTSIDSGRDLLGREALLRQRHAGPTRRLPAFVSRIWEATPSVTN